MKAAAFDYHLPPSVGAAVKMLAELGDEAKVLAGGQSLVPVMAMRLGRFFVSAFTAALEPNELVTAIHLPLWGRGSGFAMAEIARRHGDFAIADAACGVQVDGGRITRAAVGLIGVGSVPVRATAAERALGGAGLS